ncbi:PREDICTED: uncharacterized protein LOC104613171 isoform X2 [Nelumbo nucifera]|uniref:Uncharacterized protein LOC104613171 isoform X2 n=1 Tax=Nelumbo nucifera TaxID=4432 RepID=A0A1U8QCI2_NELNU|nr:PREDICTED: uncharacterized protein LOC104613171 isoform X2 [Nelumbo nucifera]
MENSRRSNRGIEENTLAIFDSSGVKDARDVNDDRLAFLEAVRASSIVPQIGTAPTSKMLNAIFQILKDGTSLELIMASYQLLIELEKRFPRVYLSKFDIPKSSSGATVELIVINEAWSPFALGSESAYSERNLANRSSDELLDSLGFSLLLQGIAQLYNEMNLQVLDTKSLGNMLLFQFLVNVLEGDFLPRNTIYNETKNWVFLRESLLSMLLGSRRISYKSLIKDCLSIISERCRKDLENSSIKTVDNSDAAALGIALAELERGTCIAVQKLLIMELDKSKKQADMQGSTSRSDGSRIPLMEVILDELTYDEDLLSSFLQVFCDPKWRLEIILQYFSKYLTKPSVRTRKSNNSSDDATFHGVLKCFSNVTSAKSIVKKMSIEIAQLLLANGFNAFISLQEAGGISVLQICKDIVSAFHNLRIIDDIDRQLCTRTRAIRHGRTILYFHCGKHTKSFHFC